MHANVHVLTSVGALFECVPRMEKHATDFKGGTEDGIRIRNDERKRA